MKIRKMTTSDVYEIACEEKEEQQEEETKSVYTCSHCKYTSDRYYNVTRHEHRIHSIIPVPRVCCGQEFVTKGDYYVHCERKHPHKRQFATVSRLKYKILNSEELNSKKRLRRRNRRRTYGKRKARGSSCTLQRRYSERIRKRGSTDSRKTESEVTFKYSITYREFDENAPLSNFIENRRKFRSYSRIFRECECKYTRYSVSRSTGSSGNGNDSGTDNGGSNDDNGGGGGGDAFVSCGKRRCEDGETEGSDDIDVFVPSQLHVSDETFSASASISDSLPVKKLLLRRFMKKPLEERAQQNNLSVSYDASKQIKRTINRERSYDLIDKENIQQFEFENVNIRIDSCITEPQVTTHLREFLSSIDFDSFKHRRYF